MYCYKDKSSQNKLTAPILSMYSSTTSVTKQCPAFLLTYMYMVKSDSYFWIFEGRTAARVLRDTSSLHYSSTTCRVIRDKHLQKRQGSTELEWIARIP
jgi:hypothetical protein